MSDRKRLDLPIHAQDALATKRFNDVATVPAGWLAGWLAGRAGMHDRALVSIGKVPKLVCEGSYQVRFRKSYAMF